MGSMTVRLRTATTIEATTTRHRQQDCLHRRVISTPTVATDESKRHGSSTSGTATASNQRNKGRRHTFGEDDGCKNEKASEERKRVCESGGRKKASRAVKYFGITRNLPRSARPGLATQRACSRTIANNSHFSVPLAKKCRRLNHDWLHLWGIAVSGR